MEIETIEIIKETLNGFYEVMTDESLLASMAKMYAGIVKSLEAEGFAREEAMKIACEIKFSRK